MATKTKDRNLEGFSDSTRRAKWVEAAGDHEDRKGQTLATRSHDVIKRWAEERDAVPATVMTKETVKSGEPRVLRFDFGDDDKTGKLKQIDWDEWFRVFDDREVVMLFQEHRRDGKQSNFFRFDSPHREDA